MTGAVNSSVKLQNGITSNQQMQIQQQLAQLLAANNKLNKMETDVNGQMVDISQSIQSQVKPSIEKVMSKLYIFKFRRGFLLIYQN